VTDPAGAGPTTRGSRRRVHRAGAAAGVLAVGGLLVAACSSTPSANGTTTTAPPTTTTTAAPSTTSSSTTTTAATTATCLPTQLKITPQQGSGAAGTIELSFLMVNTSSTNCSMQGYPGLQLLSSAGAALPTNVIRGGGPSFPTAAANNPPTLVVLAPQQSAAFSLSFEDVPVGTETTCPTSSMMEITPPNDTAHAVVNVQIDACGGGTIHVSPVYALTT